MFCQAAEEAERKAKEEAERKAKEEAAKSPAQKVRDILGADGTAAAVDYLNGLKVETGPAGRMSYLLEVGPLFLPDPKSSGWGSSVAVIER